MPLGMADVVASEFIPWMGYSISENPAYQSRICGMADIVASEFIPWRER